MSPLLSVHPPQARLTSLTALHLGKLRRLPDELLGDGQPRHDVHLDGLLAAQELDPLGDLEAEAAVEFEVERVAAFEVAGAVFDVGLVGFFSINFFFSPRQYGSLLFFCFFFFFQRGKDMRLRLSELGVRDWLTYLLGCILNQGFRIAFAPRGRFRANVDEIPGVVVVFAEDVVFGVVQKGQELVEQALPALFGELPAEAVHAAPEHGAEVVHVFLRGHPVFSRLLLVALLLICLTPEVCLILADSMGVLDGQTHQRATQS